MKYKASPQSGQRNVKLMEMNGGDRKFESMKWRKSIAEFKTKRESWKIIKVNKSEEIPEEKEHKCSAHRQFRDPNISYELFSHLDESVNRMWNSFNWGVSMETMLAGWLTREHLRSAIIRHHSHDFSHLDHIYTEVPTSQRRFKIDLLDVEDILARIDLD